MPGATIEVNNSRILFCTCSGIEVTLGINRVALLQHIFEISVNHNVEGHCDASQDQLKDIQIAAFIVRC